MKIILSTEMQIVGCNRLLLPCEINQFRAHFSNRFSIPYLTILCPTVSSASNQL